MLSETFYIVCKKCGAWTWDMRLYDFPRAVVEGNGEILDWKAKHLCCWEPLECADAKGCFDYLAESDEKVLELDPEEYCC